MSQLIPFPKQDRPIDKQIATGLTPVLFCEGPDTAAAFWQFFIRNYRNRHTREAYFRAADRFSAWCASIDLPLADVEPDHVAAYVELLEQNMALSSARLHFAALRALFDYLVVRRVLNVNPARSVKTSRFSIDKGLTPYLKPEQMKHLFDSIALLTLTDYRDRAMIAVMAYTFSRVTAVCNLKVKHYYYHGNKAQFNLTIKGNKVHTVPAHHTVQRYVDEYLDAAGIAEDTDGWLFRRIRHTKTPLMLDTPMNRQSTYKMVKRRCAIAGLPTQINNHSFRATGITTFMANGGKLERAAHIAGHANPSTTKLYDHSDDAITQDEIERILY